MCTGLKVGCLQGWLPGRGVVQGCRGVPGRSAQHLISAEVGELEVPTRVPISWRPEHFKDSLGADERNDQVVLGRRDEAPRIPVRDEACRHRSTHISFGVAERPDPACQVPYQPVDVGLFPIEKSCDSSIVNQHIPGKDVVVGNPGCHFPAAIDLGDQPDHLATGVRDKG